MWYYMNANVRETTKRIIPAKSVKCSEHNSNNIQHNVAMSGVTPNIPHFSHYTLYCIIQQVPGSPGYIPTYQPPYNWAVVKAKLFAPRSPRPVEAVPTVTSSYLPRRRWRGVYNYRPADIFMLNLQFSRNNMGTPAPASPAAACRLRSRPKPDSTPPHTIPEIRTKMPY